ncbi:ABC transporter permease [Paenibacillus athensensis]|uniref:ABC transporter permease n=1 Tax=Paenibacillus athensensis TaxID=1967502 RepID=A0A4Y8Q560_9BACL|nr:ABC transporter permease [Paenibacillus athensensis]MCD1259624.1 ABC transporter permease [Paenibacillus athensensis]
MASLYASFWNETMKLTLRKKMLWFLGVTLLLPVAAGLLLGRLQSGIGIASVGAGDFPVVMLGLFTTLFFPLFIFMGAADQFAGEIGDRTMKLALTRPITRLKVYAGKLLALALFIALLLAAGLAASALAGLWLNGAAGLGGGLAESLLAYAAAFAPLLTLSLGAALLAQLFASGSGALTVSLLAYIALKAAGFFFPQALTYSPTAYTDWHLLWIGSGAGAGHIAGVFMFLAACSILFFTAGYALFERKEI